MLQSSVGLRIKAFTVGWGWVEGTRSLGPRPRSDLVTFTVMKPLKTLHILLELARRTQRLSNTCTLQFFL